MRPDPSRRETAYAASPAPTRPLLAVAGLAAMALCLVLLSLTLLFTFPHLWALALVPLIGAVGLVIQIIDTWKNAPRSALRDLEQRLTVLEMPGGTDLMLEPETRRALQLMYRTLLAESKEAISRSLNEADRGITQNLGRLEGALMERLSRTQAELVRLERIETDLMRLADIERELGKLDQLREDIRRIGGMEPHLDRLYEIQAQLRVLSDIERDLGGLKQGQEKLTKSADDLKEEIRNQGDRLSRIERTQSNPLQVIPGGLQDRQRTRGPRRQWDAVPFDPVLVDSWKTIYEIEDRRGAYAMAPFWCAYAQALPRAFVDELNRLENGGWTDAISVKDVMASSAAILVEAAKALEDRDYFSNAARMEARFSNREKPLLQAERVIRTSVATVVSNLDSAEPLALEKTAESVDNVLEDLRRRLSRGGTLRPLLPVSFDLVQMYRPRTGAGPSQHVAYALIGRALAEYLQQHYSA